MTVFAKIKVRCELLGAVAERLVPLGAVDPVEPNTLAYAIVQDRDRVVVHDAHNLAGKGCGEGGRCSEGDEHRGSEPTGRQPARHDTFGGRSKSL